MSVAAAIRKMLAAGLSIEQSLIAVEAMEEQAPVKRQSARSERNAKYYEKNRETLLEKAAERRLKSSDQSENAEPSETSDSRLNSSEFDASSRIGALAEPELTNLELYPEEQERKNIVGFPKGRKTQPRNQKPSYSPLYELVWQTLPRHPNSSKADGYREFLRLSEEDQNRALDGAMAWQEIIIETRQRQPGYEPPHMSTWLHKRRFDDALDAKPQFRMYGQ